MTDAELARAYLADRDAPCPACGYNLRGGGGEVCPECGVPLAVRLVAASSLPVPDPAVEAIRVREYLRDHDARCPRCRAPLRGEPGPACLGCGQVLSVWILKPPGLDAGRAAQRRAVLLGCAGVLFALLIMAAAVMLYTLGRVGGP